MPGAANNPTSPGQGRRGTGAELQPFRSATFKLSVFQPTFSDEEILLNPEDVPGLKGNDLIDIHDLEHELDRPKLLLRVTAASVDATNGVQKGCVYLAKSVSDHFQLRHFQKVVVIKKEDNATDSIALGSVELIFREQYLGRSEMWRIKSQLVGKAVRSQQTLTTLGQGLIRCTVADMWANGEAVACGTVAEETKIVFRSPTAMVYLFIQMSREMWAYDGEGRPYWELAVDGFLKEMFERWKKTNASHEVTIVLFSRLFYKGDSVKQFPPKTRSCLQEGFNGRIYEDYYRVVVQNERFDDWTSTLYDLRDVMENYDRELTEYHGRRVAEAGLDPTDVPSLRIGKAEEGNFLEVLNATLNTFESHYLNRNLERTGQQSIVITPGVGIFEVDRELAQITKQRIIDSGVGIDLICLGEQPLHSVPLLKFVQKPGEVATISKSDLYNMPHWINLSVYGDPCLRADGRHVVRVRAAQKKSSVEEEDRNACPHESNRSMPMRWPFGLQRPELFNLARQYSESFTPARSVLRLRVAARRSNSVFEAIAEAQGACGGAEAVCGQTQTSIPEEDVADNNDLTWTAGDRMAASVANGGRPIKRAESAGDNGNGGLASSLDGPFDHRTIRRELLDPGRRASNPFAPSNSTFKVTSNRRRWTHIFPKDRGGAHQQPFQADRRSQGRHMANAAGDAAMPVAASLYAWASAEAARLDGRGVDWKSLITPASLPVTTDYFPGMTSIRRDYQITNYEMKPDEFQADKHLPNDAAPLGIVEVFLEMVSQRLAQGFQVVLLSEEEWAAQAEENARAAAAATVWKKASVLIETPVTSYDPKSVVAGSTIWLSLGAAYHKLSLRGKTISVVIYKQPQDPGKKNMEWQYRYRFQAPDNNTYEVSWTKFKTEKLDDYPWNFLDHYVCTRGDREYRLTDSVKYWRFRMYLFPIIQEYTSTSKEIKGSNDDRQRCDIFPVEVLESRDPAAVTVGFLRFIDSCLNRVKRKAAEAAKEGTAKLPANASFNDIVARMKAKEGGLIFYEPEGAGLPDFAFLSYDFVMWAKANVEGVEDVRAALGLGQALMDKSLVCHASGKQWSKSKKQGKPFVYGYCLFALGSGGKRFPYGGDFDAFAGDFVEVEFDLKEGENDGQKEPFAAVRIEPSPGKPTDRPEWAHMQYQLRRDSSRDTFELCLYWTVASGAVVADLGLGWARKANQCGLALLPIPDDPFALPITAHSDPVRGPIFVGMARLGEEGEGKAEVHDVRLREAIARKFGFVPCVPNARLRREDGRFSTKNQYVHYSGNMFLLIPAAIELQRGIQGVGVEREEAAEDLKVISKSISGRRPVYDHSKTGFLWSWNFMASRRWRNICNTGATGNIAFMDKMLLDFRAFCANEDGRLEAFAKEFHAKNQPVSSD